MTYLKKRSKLVPLDQNALRPEHLSHRQIRQWMVVVSLQILLR